MKTVSMSEIKSFLNCRKAWQYGYLDKLTTVYTNPNFLFGTAVHKFLQKFYDVPTLNRTYDYISHCYDATLSELKIADDDERYKDLKAVLKMYVLFEQYNPINANVLFTEKELQFPITKFEDVNFLGIIDMIVRNKDTGGLEIFDHKTSRVMVRSLGLDIEMQASAYAWLVWKNYGEVPEKIVFNTISKSPKEWPKELKNGTISKAKDNNTTAELLLECIEMLGADKADYLDTIEYLKTRPSVIRHETIRTLAQLETFDTFLTEVYEQMYTAELNVNKIVANPNGFNCSYCMYLPLHILEDKKENTSFMRNMSYITKNEKKDMMELENYE